MNMTHLMDFVSVSKIQYDAVLEASSNPSFQSDQHSIETLQLT